MHQLPAEIKSCNVVVVVPAEAFLGQQKLNHKQGHGICMLEDNKSKPWLCFVCVCGGKTLKGRLAFFRALCNWLCRHTESVA